MRKAVQTQMKTISLTLYISGAICAMACAATAAEAPRAGGLIDCDQGKVALFEDTQSEHGRYSAGWTIRVRNKQAKPVDWSLWTAEGGTGPMREKYIYPGEENPNFPYEFMNGVVDLKRKTFLKLPSKIPFWGQSHGSFGAFWGEDTKLPTYGLIQNQARFATNNLWLIRIDESGMTEADIDPPLEKAVRKLLQEKMPLNADGYAISFPQSEWDDDGGEPEFHADSVEIPFTANLPKSGFDRVTGKVTVHLPDGGILKITSPTPPDDPFHSDNRLAKADQELNAIYAALQKQLDAAGNAALKKEQIAWLSKRDADARLKDYPIAGDENDPAKFKRDRNESLFKSTLRRVDELKKKLKH